MPIKMMMKISCSGGGMEPISDANEMLDDIRRRKQLQHNVNHNKQDRQPAPPTAIQSQTAQRLTTISSSHDHHHHHHHDAHHDHDDREHDVTTFLKSIQTFSSSSSHVSESKREAFTTVQYTTSSVTKRMLRPHNGRCRWLDPGNRSIGVQISSPCLLYCLIIAFTLLCLASGSHHESRHNNPSSSHSARTSDEAFKSHLSRKINETNEVMPNDSPLLSSGYHFEAKPSHLRSSSGYNADRHLGPTASRWGDGSGSREMNDEYDDSEDDDDDDEEDDPDGDSKIFYSGDYAVEFSHNQREPKPKVSLPQQQAGGGTSSRPNKVSTTSAPPLPHWSIDSERDRIAPDASLEGVEGSGDGHDDQDNHRPHNVRPPHTFASEDTVEDDEDYTDPETGHDSNAGIPSQPLSTARVTPQSTTTTTTTTTTSTTPGTTSTSTSTPKPAINSIEDQDQDAAERRKPFNSREESDRDEDADQDGDKDDDDDYDYYDGDKIEDPSLVGPSRKPGPAPGSFDHVATPAVPGIVDSHPDYDDPDETDADRDRDEGAHPFDPEEPGRSEDSEDNEDDDDEYDYGLPRPKATPPHSSTTTTSTTTTTTTTSTTSTTTTSTTPRPRMVERPDSGPVFPWIPPRGDKDKNEDDDDNDRDGSFNRIPEFSIPEPPVWVPPRNRFDPDDDESKNQDPDHDDSWDGNTLKNDVAILGRKRVEDEYLSGGASFFARPGILAAVIGGAVVGLLSAILLVMFIVYRMRKKDEGSYPVDDEEEAKALRGGGGGHHQHYNLHSHIVNNTLLQHNNSRTANGHGNGHPSAPPFRQSLLHSHPLNSQHTTNSRDTANHYSTRLYDADY